MSLPSSGTAKFLTNVNVRAGPTTGSSAVAMYHPGETVRFDRVVNGDGRTWISYIGGSGNRRYCCAIDRNGEKYIDIGDDNHVLPYLQQQSSKRGVRVSGCLFCACCWLASLKSIAEVDNAFEWCVNRGYVRRSDAYCLGPSREPLARKIAEYYGRPFKNGFSIRQGRNHFYVVDSSGKEAYNSAGWGYGH